MFIDKQVPQWLGGCVRELSRQREGAWLWKVPVEVTDSLVPSIGSWSVVLVLTDAETPCSKDHAKEGTWLVSASC